MIAVAVALAVALALAVAAGLFVDMHPHFDFERWPGFFAATGFAGCVLLVALARLLGHMLDRRDDADDR